MGWIQRALSLNFTQFHSICSTWPLIMQAPRSPAQPFFYGERNRKLTLFPTSRKVGFIQPNELQKEGKSVESPLPPWHKLPVEWGRHFFTQFPLYCAAFCSQIFTVFQIFGTSSSFLKERKGGESPASPAPSVSFSPGSNPMSCSVSTDSVGRYCTLTKRSVILSTTAQGFPKLNHQLLSPSPKTQRGEKDTKLFSKYDLEMYFKS